MCNGIFKEINIIKGVVKIEKDIKFINLFKFDFSVHRLFKD